MQTAADNSGCVLCRLHWRREVGRVNTAAEGESAGLYDETRVRKTSSLAIQRSV